MTVLESAQPLVKVAAVPEVPVAEHGDLGSGKDDIRPSGKRGRQPVAQAQPSELTPKKELALGIALPTRSARRRAGPSRSRAQICEARSGTGLRHVAYYRSTWAGRHPLLGRGSIEEGGEWSGWAQFVPSRTPSTEYGQQPGFELVVPHQLLSPNHVVDPSEMIPHAGERAPIPGVLPAGEKRRPHPGGVCSAGWSAARDVPSRF